MGFDRPKILFDDVFDKFDHFPKNEWQSKAQNYTCYPIFISETM